MPVPSESPKNQQRQAQTPFKIRKVQIIFLLGFIAVTFIGFSAMKISRTNHTAASANPYATSGDIIYSSPHSYSKPVAQTKIVKLNAAVPDFSARDINGQTLRLADWKGKLGILFFADLSCPCVQAYNGRMKALQQKYSDQGLQIAYVFSDANDNIKGIQTLAQTEKYPWRNLQDADQKLLRLFNVQCTTEAFLIDREGVLRYHGRVDDSTFEPDKAKSSDLENALNALLSNQPIKIPETQAYACTIPRLKKPKRTL